MGKYLELFLGEVGDLTEKTKLENKPYVAYSTKLGKVVYTVVPTKEEPSLYEAVDLGLPSGLKWANMNVGATSPEDAGLYFQWGDTVGYTKEQVEAGEKVFDWSTYFDTNDGGSTFNKYAVDKLTVLESEDDAATAHMGSEWRMPTEEQIQELLDNTIPTFIDFNNNTYSHDEVYTGVVAENLKGVRFTGSNGNSIFLPATGSISGGIGSFVGTWSSSLSDKNSYMAKYLFVHCVGELYVDTPPRNEGFYIRGVQA